MGNKYFFVMIAYLLYSNILYAQDNHEFNTIIMQSTFKILEENDYLGTAFIVGEPTYPDSKYGYTILVTAKHVLDRMTGDSITIQLRKKNGDTYIKFAHKIPIRNKGRNLYTSHPTEDVAVIRISFPAIGYKHAITTSIFATDSLLESIDLHPGDELFALGYPLGFESNAAGFSVLRSGRIASYPIIPTKYYKTFFLDFEIFKGNSGGPVYFCQNIRVIQNRLTNKYYNFLIGLVSQEVSYKEHIKTLTEEKIIEHKLSIASIIHSTYILETINMLPKK